MAVKMKVEGFAEIEKALAELAVGTSKGVARRAMKKELDPIMEMANAFWPGARDDVFQIRSRIRRGQMAGSLMKRGRSIVNMFVGAPGGAKGTPHAHLIEWGTGPRYTTKGAFRGSVSPTPMLQPAWDAHKHKILDGLGARLWDEIQKTQARLTKRAAARGGTR